MSGFKNIQVLLSADSGNLKRGLAQASAAVNTFEKDVKAANSSAAGAGAGLKAGLALGAVAVAVGLGYAITKAIEFDKAMRNTQSLTQQSEGSFKQLENSVISMSKRLPQSATTLAEGLYDIASSGFQGADGLKILESSAQAASAGLSTTAISARAITGVINAYGLSANDAAYVSDVLFQTVNLGVVSFDELAGAIGNVLGSAAAAKVSIAEVGSAIATMTLAGIGGAEATTSLNNLITKIIQPSEALQGAFKKMGYETGEQALKANGLHGVMEKLRVSTGGNITTLLQYFPEIRAARGALALMANEGKNYNKVSSEIDNKNKVAGATMRTLKVQMQGVSLQWQLFKNGIDAAAISLGVKILPAISGLMTGLQNMGPGIGDVLNSLSPFKDAAIAVGQALMALGTFIGPVVVGLAKVAGTAAIGVLILLAKTLEAGANIIKDHAAIVTMLAIAYGVHLLGALIAASGGISVIAWEAFGTVLVGLLGAADGASVALYGLATAEAAATLGIAAIVTAGIFAWNGYSTGADKAADATKAVNAAVKSVDFNVIKKGAAEGQKAIDAANAKLAGQQAIPFWKRVFDVGNNMEALGLMNSIDDVVKGVDTADVKIATMRRNTLRYLADDTGLTGSALNKAMIPVTASLEATDAAVVKLAVRAKAAGVSLGDPYTVVKIKLDAYKASTEGTAGAQQRVIDAMGQMGSSASSTAEQVDTLKTRIDELTGAAMGADEASDNFEATLDKMTATLKKNGKTLDGTTEKGRESKASIRASTEGLLEHVIAQAKMGKSGASLSKILTTGILDLYKHADAANFSRSAMQDLLNQYNLTPALVSTIVEAIGAGKSAEEIKAMMEAAAALQNKQVTVNAVGQVLSKDEVAALDVKIKGLQGKIVAAKQRGATESSVEVQKLRAQIAALTPKTVTVREAEALASAERVRRLQAAIAAVRNKIVVAKANGASESSAEVRGLRDQLAYLTNKTVHVTTIMDTILHPTVSRPGVTLPAQGTILQTFGQGGTHLPKIATIAKDGANLVQWAEPGTGGEGFIPLAKNRRKRSTTILAQIAEMFGLGLSDASGKPVTVFSNGSSTQPPGLQRFARGGISQRQADRNAASAVARANARTYGIYTGHDAGTLGYTSDVNGTLGNIQSQLDTKLQAHADWRAATSGNASDTGEDYYKKTAANAKTYIAGLAAQTKAQRAWGTDLSKIASVAGGDVADSLAKMGDQGKDAVAAMAHATTADLKKMAAAMRAMEFDKFITMSANNAKGQAAFQANLLKLVKMGRAGLAAKFAEMGYDSAGNLAAAAVTASGSALTQLNNDLTSSGLASSDGMKQALKLAGLLQGSQGALGVVGLAKASGIGVADLMGLLQTYGGPVFSTLGTAMAQVNKDLALINSGKQPSGLANGGIVPGGQQQGLYYQWAEKGAGGESLIPLGVNQRNRAKQLWHETGRILGERPAGSSVGGSSIMIAKDAVRLDLHISGTNLTAAQLQKATQAAASQALTELTTRLRAGRR